MGQVYPKNYPVAEIISVYADPGQDFVVVKARPLAQIASTRHVMVVLENETAPIQVNSIRDPAATGLDADEFLPLPVAQGQVIRRAPTPDDQ
jgi:cell shape-determining protein MreC